MQVEDYMNETPLRLLEMLTQTREDLWRAAQALTERGVTRIILTGSGTSYHGALTARTFMQRWCALPVDVCWPFMLDDETLARSGKALVVGISQGGGSLSTGEQRRSLLLRMEKTFNHLPALVTASQAWAQTNALALRDSADIRLTGPATLFGTVQEGALKMLETLRCPVSGYEFEEFIHGIYNAFNAQSALIRLAQILGEWTPSIYRIGPQVENNGLNLNFPFVNDEDFAVFEYIIPLQMLCAILPPQKGINPAIPKDPQFHQKMKSKQEI